MNKMLKRVFVIVYMIDFLLIPLNSYMLVWWEKEHNRPGLAEMTDGKGIAVRLIVEIIVFIVLTVVLVKSRKSGMRVYE